MSSEVEAALAAKVSSLEKRLAEAESDNIQQHRDFEEALSCFETRISQAEEREKKRLQHIGGMCGAPNAADGCRNILAFVREVLKGAGDKEEVTPEIPGQ